MLGIPLHFHDRADHGSDVLVVLGTTTYYEIFDIGQAYQDEAIGCPRIAV